MTEKEKRLLAGCIHGDKPSWDAFVEQYSSLVYHTIKKTLALHRDKLLAETVDDLFQEIFLSLVKDDCLQLRRFRGDRGCSLATWLRMIAARRTIDYLRKPKSQSERLDSLAHGFGEDAQEKMADEQLEQLENAVAGLQPRDRILLDLVFRQGVAPQVVASILRISIAAVYTQKSRIFAKLRETLEKSTSR